MTDWQPIETAPKDARPVLLAWPSKYVGIGHFDADRFNKKPHPMFVGHYMGVIWMRSNQPTHWMPLPAPPEKDS